MYRRPRFLEVLLTIREEMAREADYDVDLYVEIVRNGSRPASGDGYSLAEPDERTAQQPARKRSRKEESGDVD
jgi:hypothetical protein